MSPWDARRLQVVTVRRLALVFVLAATACDGATIEGVLRADADTTCGDAMCTGDEHCGTCPADCGACAPGCGDGMCAETETCGSCPSDCGRCVPVCGDGTCSGGEQCSTCPADCGACSATCGDGMCSNGEQCSTCPADCGACTATCGDSVCDATESCASCASDCGSCAMCGDGTCDPTEDCGTCSADCGECTWPPELTATEDEMLVLVNELRSTGATCGGQRFDPVPALAMHEALRDAARGHSLDMGEQNYFDHTSLDGRSPWQRIADAGYPGSGVAENIAAGNNSAQATFRQWVDSPGHCRNMMTANGREIGIGHAAVAGSRFRHYWTQAFGRR